MAGIWHQAGCCCDDVPQDCPQKCDDCEDPLVATITGAEGGDEDCDCEVFNNDFTLARLGCNWVLNIGIGDVLLWCSGQAWHLTINCVVGAGFAITWEAPNITGCPPLIGWVLVDNDCDGTPVASLSVPP